MVKCLYLCSGAKRKECQARQAEVCGPSGATRDKQLYLLRTGQDEQLRAFCAKLCPYIHVPVEPSPRCMHQLHVTRDNILQNEKVVVEMAGWTVCCLPIPQQLDVCIMMLALLLYW